MRFYAVFIVEKPHDFALQVLNGVKIGKMKDKTGKLMRDAYLVEQLSRKYPWIRQVYERTSGYVHLSDTHIFNTFAPTRPEDRKERKQNLTIGPGDCFETDAFYEEANEAFVEATRVLLNYVVGWTKTKQKPPHL